MDLGFPYFLQYLLLRRERSLQGKPEEVLLMRQLGSDFITLLLNLPHSLFEGSTTAFIIKTGVSTNGAMVGLEWLTEGEQPVIDYIGDTVIEAESIGLEVIPTFSF